MLKQSETAANPDMRREDDEKLRKEREKVQLHQQKEALKERKKNTKDIDTKHRIDDQMYALDKRKEQVVRKPGEPLKQQKGATIMRTEQLARRLQVTAGRYKIESYDNNQQDGTTNFALYKDGSKVAFTDFKRDATRKAIALNVNVSGTGNITPEEALDFATQLTKMITTAKKKNKLK
jgi:hypothetical protein